MDSARGWLGRSEFSKPAEILRGAGAARSLTWPETEAIGSATLVLDMAETIARRADGFSPELSPQTA